MQPCSNSEYSKTAISGKVSGILAISGDDRQHSGTSGNVREQPAAFGDVRQHSGKSGSVREYRDCPAKSVKAFLQLNVEPATFWMNSVSK